jgi:superfamily II DNA or RNA helicase
MTKKIFRLALSEAGLACSSYAWVEKLLTLRVRKMIKDGRRSKMVNEDLCAWTNSQWSDGDACIVSYPGFWADVKREAIARGFDVEVSDDRSKLPPPNISAAMRGMLAPQKAWLLSALVADCSGLLGAPTRFGKSYAIKGFCKAYPGQKIVVTAPGKDLCRQLYNFLVKELPERKVNGVWSGSPHRVQSDDITVCSIDSLDKMDDDTDLLLIDEPHACVADGRIVKISRFQKARRVGFGATLTGRFDKKDRLIVGVIGPVISSVSYKEAVASGSISPLKVIIKRIQFSKDTVPGKANRDQVYDRLLRKSQSVMSFIKHLSDNLLPQDWQLMTFISNEAQADFLMDKAMPKEATVAMAKKMKEKVRDTITVGIALGQYLRVVASRIYIQGVTFPLLKMVVNAEGGGPNTGAIQKPGRLLQAMPGKNYGVFLDFVFECIDEGSDPREFKPYSSIVGEAHSRIKAYRDIGYDVIFLDPLNEDDQIKEILKGSYDEK